MVALPPAIPSSSVCLWQCPDYHIETGAGGGEFMHIIVGEFALCMPLHVFEEGHARSAEIIAAWRSHSAEIIPLRAPRRLPSPIEVEPHAETP